VTAALRGATLYAWSRHRGLILAASVVYLVALLSYDRLWALEGKPFVVPLLTFLRAAPFFLPLLILTSTASVATADLATRDSWYPRHFFALPLTARQLALPFMLCTVGLYALLWTAGVWISDGRILYSGPLELPRERLQLQSWDPFLQLALLVWLQALIWTPFKRRWSRVVALFALCAAYFAALILSINAGLPAGAIVAFCAAQLPAAYAVGVRGVALARIGGRQPVRPSGASPRRKRAWTALSLASLRSAPQPALTSGADAQAWFERSVQRGRSTFVLTFLIPLVLLVVLLGHLANASAQDSAALAQGLIGLLIFTLVFVGLATGPAFAAFDTDVQPFNSQAFRMPSFLGVLPLGAGDFAWAKLANAARRMGFVAAVMLAAALLIAWSIGLHDTWAVLLDRLSDRHGPIEAAFLLSLGPAAFLLAASVGTANVVWIGMLGRGWALSAASVIVTLIAIAVFGIWATSDPTGLQTSADALSALLPYAAAAKLGLLAWLMHLVGARRLYSWGRLAFIGGAWLALVAAGFGVYLRYAPDAGPSASTAAALLILLTPIVGILAAPLALQWNRCR
jgi:hypothetical protein